MTLSLSSLLRASALSSAMLSRTHCLRARRGHGGIQQAAKHIERLALLEQALETPTRERTTNGGTSDTASALASSDTAAFLRGVPEHIAEVRQRQHHHGTRADPTRVAHGEDNGDGTTLHEHDVISLQHFLAECKRHRLDIGTARQPDERRRRRQRYRAFWDHNSGSAVRCCQATGGRDFSFVALHGLADEQLHLDFEAMIATLRVLEQERPISSCMDMTRSLQYLARELAWLEKQHSRPRDSKASSSSGEGMPSVPPPEALKRFRGDLTNLAMERIVFFFAENAPAKTSLAELASRRDFALATARDSQLGRQSTSLPVFSSGALLGTSEDALSALEVLSVVKVTDLSPAVAQALVARITAAEHARYTRHCEFMLSQLEPLSVLTEDGPQSEAARRNREARLPPPPSPVRELTQWDVVSRTFCFVAHEHRQLSFTSVVQAFALLRIFLPVLWPPYGPRTATPTQAPNSSSSSRTATHLGDEKDVLQRICWSLAVALKKRDQRFTNPHHLVKIVTSLARLPSFVLSPAPAATRQLREQERDDTRSASGSSASPGAPAPPSAPRTGTAVWTAEAFWAFVVSKACIFVPNLPLDQRRLVCRGLDLAIREKRGRLLGAQTSPSPHRASSRPDLQDLQGTAEDILLPLVEDMASLEENYDVAVQRARENARGYEKATSSRPPPTQQRPHKGKNRPRRHSSNTGQ